MIGKAKFNKNGFTLIELAVAGLVGLLALLVVFCVCFTIQDSIGLTTGILDIAETGRFAVNRISGDIRNAKSVISFHNTYTTGNTAVILRIPSIDSNGNMIDPENVFDIVIYTIDPADPARLLRIVDANPLSAREDLNEVLAENIDTLLFSSGGTGLSYVSDKTSVKTLTTRIRTSENLMGSERVNEIATSISLRNKKIGH